MTSLARFVVHSDVRPGDKLLPNKAHEIAYPLNSSLRLRLEPYEDQLAVVISGPANQFASLPLSGLLTMEDDWQDAKTGAKMREVKLLNDLNVTFASLAGWSYPRFVQLTSRMQVLAPPGSEVYIWTQSEFLTEAFRRREKIDPVSLPWLSRDECVSVGVADQHTYADIVRWRDNEREITHLSKALAAEKHDFSQFGGNIAGEHTKTVTDKLCRLIMLRLNLRIRRLEQAILQNSIADRVRDILNRDDLYVDTESLRAAGNRQLDTLLGDDD